MHSATTRIHSAPATAVERRGFNRLVVRTMLLAVGLLFTLNFPVASLIDDDTHQLGWEGWTTSERGVAEQVVVRTVWFAMAAGLRPGDRILELNGEPATPGAVARARAGASADDTTVLTVLRGDRTLQLRIPVLKASPSYRGYLSYRAALAAVAWAVGMALILFRGDRATALVFGAALLLCAPASFPGGLPREGVLAVAQPVWQILAGAYRFLFPALLVHLLLLYAGRPAWLRARRLEVGIYGIVGVTVLLVTDFLREPLVWTESSVSRDLRGVVGLGFELAVLAMAIHVRKRRPPLPGPLRWLVDTILVRVVSGSIFSVLMLAGNEGHASDLLRQISAITITVLTALAAILFFVADARGASEWDYRRRLARIASVGLTTLYGLLVALAAAIMLGMTRHSLHGTDWLLLGTVFGATLVFSPLVPWARELVGKWIFSRWLEVETRAEAFVNRISSELVLDRIGDRVREELPSLLRVTAADLTVAEEFLVGRSPRTIKHLRVLPRAALEAELGQRPSGGSVVLPINIGGGELVATLRIGSPTAEHGADFPDAALLRTLRQGIAAALRSAGTYLDLRAAQQELTEAERVASLGAIAGGLAHEIKNPLAGLKMGLYVMGREGMSSERLARIRLDMQRIDDLVSGLLRFTNGGAEEVPVPVEFTRLVRECVADQASLADDRCVRITPDLPQKPIVVLGSPSQLRLIVSNLLKNAMDAVEDGGAVDIELTTRGDAAVFVVRDSGPGIPAEIRDRIFDLAFSTKPGGSGIGLALARREVERLRGTISIETSDYHGTALRISLPRIIHEEVSSPW